MKKHLLGALMISIVMLSCSEEKSNNENETPELTEEQIQQNKETIENAESIHEGLTSNEEELNNKEAELDSLLNDL